MIEYYTIIGSEINCNAEASDRGIVVTPVNENKPYSFRYIAVDPSESYMEEFEWDSQFDIEDNIITIGRNNYDSNIKNMAL